MSWFLEKNVGFHSLVIWVTSYSLPHLTKNRPCLPEEPLLLLSKSTKMVRPCEETNVVVMDTRCFFSILWDVIMLEICMKVLGIFVILWGGGAGLDKEIAFWSLKVYGFCQWVFLFLSFLNKLKIFERRLWLRAAFPVWPKSQYLFHVMFHSSEDQSEIFPLIHCKATDGSRDWFRSLFLISVKR